jgi:hypothetical protein
VPKIDRELNHENIEEGYMKKIRKPATAYDPFTGFFPKQFRDQIAILIERAKTPADLDRAAKAIQRLKAPQSAEFYLKRDKLITQVKNCQLDDWRLYAEVVKALDWLILPLERGRDYGKIERDLSRRVMAKSRKLRGPVAAEELSD